MLIFLLKFSVKKENFIFLITLEIMWISKAVLCFKWNLLYLYKVESLPLYGQRKGASFFSVNYIRIRICQLKWKWKSSFLTYCWLHIEISHHIKYKKISEKLFIDISRSKLRIALNIGYLFKLYLIMNRDTRFINIFNWYFNHLNPIIRYSLKYWEDSTITG